MMSPVGTERADPYAALIVLIVGGTAWLLSRRSGPAAGALLSLFSVASVTESTRETIETPDPTSIEFESTFKGLMCEALGKDHAWRLVLVVDNLDRVAPDDARSIWSTLQTFLHHSDDDHQSWLDSLWVLLPYDREGISRLWGEPVAGIGGETQARPALAESFIGKSIQVRFEVPLPLLSDWRAYLEWNLRSVLPDCGEADGYRAYRLYAHRLAGTAEAPSPREVKQYVNRIGALHRQWQHELPFVSLAYYASLGTNGIEVARCLREDRLPSPFLAGLLPDDADSHLAAIAFNTDPVRARQLLHGPLIEHALSRETSGELVALVGRPGFWEALPQSPILRSGMGTRALLTAARRLLDVPAEQRPEADWREVTSLLARQGLAVEDWPPLTHESAEDLSGAAVAARRPELCGEHRGPRDRGDHPRGGCGNLGRRRARAPGAVRLADPARLRRARRRLRRTDTLRRPRRLGETRRQVEDRFGHTGSTRRGDRRTDPAGPG